MFKIIGLNKNLAQFLILFKLNFSKPQMQHVIHFMESVIACEGTKTIAKLNRYILNHKDQSAFTDFFSYSPWETMRFRYQVAGGIFKILFPPNQQLSFLKRLYLFYSMIQTLPNRLKANILK
jgi:hypothetical protein